MRNPLNKRYKREFIHNKSKYLSIFLLLTLAIIVGSGFMTVMDGLIYTLDYDKTENVQEDGQFEAYEPVSEEVLTSIEKLGVTVVANFNISDDEFKGDKRLTLFAKRDKVNIQSVFEGRLPENESEVAMERVFAEKNKIDKGDKIEILGREYKVTALISLPDYTSLFKSNQDLVMNTSGFGVGVLTDEGFKSMVAGADGKAAVKYRYSYASNDDDLNDKELRELAEKIQKILVEDKVSVNSFLTAEDNQSISFLGNDLSSDGTLIKLFIYVLIAVIAFVFAIMSSNTIDSESAIIGTLRASGYKKGEIIRHYMMPTTIITFVAAIIGNILGYTVVIKPFQGMYYDTYSAPPLIIRFNPEAFVLTTVIPIVIMILINVLMLTRKLSLSPLKFLRHDLSRKKQKKAVKLPDVSFLARFRMRVIIQNIGSYLLLFAGLYIGSLLLMFSLGMNPLVEHYVDQVDEYLPYEYEYVLKAPYELSESENASAEKMMMYDMTTYCTQKKGDITVNIFGLTDNSKFFGDVKLPDAEDEAVITSALAKKLEIKEGDKITLKDDYYDKEYEVTVSGIYDYMASLGVYTKLDTMDSLLGVAPGTYNCYMSDVPLTIDSNYVLKYITRDDMLNASEQMLDSMSSMISMLLAFAIIIYLVLMYIMTKVVIEKNAIHMSFMKVFGYSTKEIRKLYLNATSIAVVASLVLGIPLVVYTFKWMMYVFMAKIEGYLEFYVSPILYVKVLVAGIGSYIVINALNVRHVSKIKMSAALKNRE